MMSNRNILMTKEVYDQILDTIAAQPPETGGVLGRKNGIICKYFYDGNADINQYRYVPNVEKINKILDQWLKDDIEFAGIIHSHPEDVNELSYADIHYATVRNIYEKSISRQALRLSKKEVGKEELTKIIAEDINGIS